ncbi:MAG TPA: Gmad2 immunoglobulin-like domain-containing protein [Candidatus Limnocylindrales bacterium]|nr:Gmad2 immunoglobulin-like domain-containing protein [Candidatus Limnocylindrales bacterium]
MNRPPVIHRPVAHRLAAHRLAALLALGLLLSACAAGVGDAGPLATPSPLTDATPTPGASSSGTPSASPAGSPSGALPTATPGSTAGPTPAPTPTPNAGRTRFAVYFLSGATLLPVEREVPATVAVARAAMTALLAGPTDEEALGTASMGTAIPPETLLLGIGISGGTATVDLSREFESGGGSASMFGRLAQVTYTLTQFPTVDRVAFRLDGKPVTTFSGEGIVLERPSVRGDYTSFLPAVFVDRPAWGARLANPARLTGLANVFEATFRYRITTADGRILVEGHAMATCGTGCWGTFDVTVPYSVRSEQAGKLTVYVASARDGSPEDVRTYDVTLTPGD